VILATAIIVGCVTAWVLFGLFFGGLQEFLECIRYMVTPVTVDDSYEKGWGKSKLYAYFALCAVVGLVTYLVLRLSFG
jgi:hypothetical protein